MDERKGRELSTWGEIAQYLGVSIRTAQNYERFGALPVRRLPGEKGRVWAFSREIDAWRAQAAPDLGSGWNTTEEGPEPTDASASPLSAQSNRIVPSKIGPVRKVRFRRSWGAVLACCFLAAAAWAWLARRHRLPTDFTVTTHALVALDQHGREVWRHTFSERLNIEAYRSLPQYDPSHHWCWPADLQGDGGREILFEYMPLAAETIGTALFCFSSRGQVRWKFVPGRVVTTGDGTSSDLYFVNSFVVLPRSALYRARLAISSVDSRTYPDQVAFLDERGHIVSEYWHSGHLLHVAAADLDGDGVEEIVLGGVNNGYGDATIVVLDPRNVSGASVQAKGDPTQLKGFGPGTEKAIVFIPPTCVGRVDNPYNRVKAIRVTPTMIEAIVSEAYHESGPYVIYRFDCNLNVLDVIPSDAFLSKHRDLELAGRIKHSFTRDELIEWRRRVRVIRKGPLGSASADPD